MSMILIMCLIIVGAVFEITDSKTTEVFDPHNVTEPQISTVYRTRCACQETLDIGPCDGAFKRFYYDIVSSKCQEFFFGGCDGNSNNFLTYDLCASQCEEINVCQQPMEIGPCDALFQRYYFNEKDNHCETFSYGGCLGNGNNFHTLVDCTSKCMPK